MTATYVVGKKISQLDPLTPVPGTAELPCVSAGQTYRATITDIAMAVSTDTWEDVLSRGNLSGANDPTLTNNATLRSLGCDFAIDADAGQNVDLRIGGVDRVVVTSSYAAFTVPEIMVVNTIAQPVTIGHQSRVGASGQSLTLHAQSVSGSPGYFRGGDLILRSGEGNDPTNYGYVQLQTGATLRQLISDNAVSLYSGIAIAEFAHVRVQFTFGGGINGSVELRPLVGTVSDGAVYAGIGTAAATATNYALSAGLGITTLNARTNSGWGVMGFMFDGVMCASLEADAAVRALILEPMHVVIKNAATVPVFTPVSGGVLYAEAGALKWRGQGGTVTTLGAA